MLDGSRFPGALSLQRVLEPPDHWRMVWSQNGFTDVQLGLDSDVTISLASLSERATMFIWSFSNRRASEL